MKTLRVLLALASIAIAGNVEALTVPARSQTFYAGQNVDEDDMNGIETAIHAWINGQLLQNTNMVTIPNGDSLMVYGRGVFDTLRTTGIFIPQAHIRPTTDGLVRIGSGTARMDSLWVYDIDARGVTSDSVFVRDSLNVVAGARSFLSWAAIDSITRNALFTAGATVPAGQTLTAAKGDVDTLSGGALFTGGLTVPAGQKATVSDGDIDTLSGGQIATGVFNISTATNWQLAATAYTGSMANLNTNVDNSMADALHRHSELSASDGTPDQAVTVGAGGLMTASYGLTVPAGQTLTAAAADIDSNKSNHVIPDGYTLTVGKTVSDSMATDSLTAAKTTITDSLKALSGVRIVGSLGIGLKPKHSNASFNAFEMGEAFGMMADVAGAGAGSGTYFFNNCYYSAGNPTYKINDEASMLDMANGILRYSNAAAGTGTITFTERWRTDANGHTMIGYSEPIASEFLGVQGTGNNYLVRVLMSSTNGNQYGLNIGYTASAPDNNLVTFLCLNDTLAARLYVYADGDVVNHDNSYGAISDEREKQDITDSPSLWNAFRSLRWVDARMKADVASHGDSAESRLCLLAQDVERIFPELVDSARTETREAGYDTTTQKILVRMSKVDAEAAGFLTSPEDPDTVVVERDSVRVDRRVSLNKNGPYRKWVNYSGISERAAKVLQEAQAKIDTLELDVMGLRAWNMTLQDSLNAQRAEIDAIKARLDKLETP